MRSITFFSYGSAALAFLALIVLLLTSWRGRAHGRMLVLACVASAISSGLIGGEAFTGLDWTPWTEAAEIVRGAAWTTCLLILIGHLRDDHSRLPFHLRPVIALLAALYVAYLGATVWGGFAQEAPGAAQSLPDIIARNAMALVGMLLVEQLYRNKPEQERWAIKFACLGIGGMFVFDFYMYSDAMLFRTISPTIWAARGVVQALTVPLIAISVARSSTWSSELAVSRRVMFHSAALFGSAAYLLLMGSAGYYLRYFGGNWGSVVQVVFLFGALVLLIGILFSGSFRAWLKVIISKHFYHYNYDYREEWLRFTRTLAQHGPKLGERTVEAVAALVESPAGLLWTRRDGGQFEEAANWHLPPSTEALPGDAPLCAYLDSKQWVIDLQEYRDDPLKYDDIALPDWLLAYPRGWLVVPLIMEDRLFGFMLLVQPRSAIALNWEVIDLLKIAGRQAANYLAQHDAANALMVARQFESFNRMSTFVVHDLKNLVAQLSLLMSNAERHKDNPDFQQDMIETVNHSVQKMKLLLQKLSRGVAPERHAALPIERVLRQAVALKAAFEPRPQLVVKEPALEVLADGERLERVVGHLIQNAIEATPREGKVDIELARAGESVRIRISDTGEGMTEEFIRERLFKPFETTKAAGMGIGMFESREYIEELGGKLEVSSAPGHGTTFLIILPLLTEAAPTLHQAA